MQRTKWAVRLGYTEDQWAAARQQVREAILESARVRMMTSYSAVAAKVTAIEIGGPHSPVLAHLLGEVLAQEREATGLALTAVVTHKTGDIGPGADFYAMARKVGFQFSDPLIFWSAQVQAIFKRYGAARS